MTEGESDGRVSGHGAVVVSMTMAVASWSTTRIGLVCERRGPSFGRPSMTCRSCAVTTRVTMAVAVKRSCSLPSVFLTMGLHYL